MYPVPPHAPPTTHFGLSIGDVANLGQATNNTVVTPVVPTNASQIVAGVNNTMISELPWKASEDPAYDFVSR